MGGRGSSFGIRSGSGQYRSFSDTASDGWNYHGSGREQVDFFRQNSNYDELIREMSSAEMGAFIDWGRGWFMRGQQYRGWDDMRSGDKELTQVYDKYLDRAELRQGVTVTRLSDAQLVLGSGNKVPSLEALRAMEGRVINSKANMSFGAAKEGLTIGSDDKKVEYRLSIPKGTKGAGMWIGDSRINRWAARQREFMSNRDSNYKVGRTTYDRDRDVYVVELKYVSRNAHDYGKSGRV